MTNIRIPGGLIDDHIELFSVNGQMMGTHKGEVKSFFDLPSELLKALKDEMYSRPSAISALKSAGFKLENEQLEKYAECRLGGFDFQADYKDGKLSDFEYHECGFRGECAMEGIVCRFLKINDSIITPFEIDMIKLLATEDTLPVITEKMNVSKNTFELKKQALYLKLGVLSRARLVSVCYDLQILNV